MFFRLQKEMNKNIATLVTKKKMLWQLKVMSTHTDETVIHDETRRRMSSR